MKLLFILILSMITAWVVAAEPVHLKGSVIDKATKQPIPGASIFISEINRTVISDENGRFEIHPLPQKNVLVQVSFIGYKSIIQKVDLSTIDLEVTFEMEESTTTIDEVVVSGAYVMSRESSPVVISKVDRSAILMHPSPSLMSTLSRVPGVSEVSMGPGISKPVIRGMSFSRVLSVYQGARFENQQWGADHGLGLTETGISGVEIIKGPASLMYGSGAMAGVIHLLEENDASAGQVEGDINLRGYSNSLGGRMEAGWKGMGANGFNWSLRGASESHADYLDGDGQAVGNTRFNTHNIKAGLGLSQKWGDTKIRYTYLKQRLGILDEDEREEMVTTRNDRNMQLPFQQVTDHFLSSISNIFLGEDKIMVTLGYHWNFREEIEDDFEGIDLGLRQQNFMYDIKYFKSFSPSLEVIVGGQGFYLQNTNYDEAEEILIPDAIKDDRSVYSLLNYNKNNWVLQGGLRYDHRKVTADARADKFLAYGFELPGAPEDRILERSFGGITASGGATFRPSDRWRFRVNLATGFRAPDLAELYSNGPHPGTSRFELGNANFEREQNVQTDLGIRYRTPHYTLMAEAFYNRVDNYIFFSATDQRVEDLVVWSFEQDDAYLYGGEALVEIHPMAMKWLNFMTSYSTVIGQRRSDLSYLPYIPAFNWNQEITVRPSFSSNSLSALYLKLLGSWVMDQQRVALLEEQTPGYYLLGANIGAELKVAGQGIDVFLSGSNLLNKTYMDHLSLYRPFGINQIGRNIALHLRYKF
ncbi:membrane protein [Anditalea andensis]|uniref:Membrane protein n=2 Tax=Anditalea andensis TaxID=1048983 RepID=A0A074LEI5_9BACT|nr:membrane protein [Anditalea andensis]